MYSSYSKYNLNKCIIACRLFGAVSPRNPNVRTILKQWRDSCIAAGEFPRAIHGWRMITLYCCTGPSEPLPNSVAIPREDQGQPDVALEIELDGKSIIKLYKGKRIKLKRGRGTISLKGDHCFKEDNKSSHKS